MIIVVMGVAGSGKTTIGTMLADALRCAWLEGDELHSRENVEKMARGVPLTDSDRAPWLSAIHDRMVDAQARGECLIVGCSALRASYREVLSAGLPVTWVYLKGSRELLASRLRNRTGHFFRVDLLDSQIETLEEPQDAIVVDVSLPPSVIVQHILSGLNAEPEARAAVAHAAGRPDIMPHDVDVRVSADLNELGVHTADAAAAAIRDVVESAGRCSLVLSGGSTPRGFHRALATRHRDDVPWANVHVFWTDERCVPHDDVRSNYGMARETLLDHVPCPAANVHPMPECVADPASAAIAYEETLRRYFGDGPPVLDLVILGLGADGHTASLFPGAPALHERTRWVLPVTADAEPPSRLTLTPPLLAGSARMWFLVAGREKAAAVHSVFIGTPQSSPAALVIAHARSRDSEAMESTASDLPGRAGRTLVWWLDADAAARLDTSRTGSVRSSALTNDDNATD